MKKQKGQSPIIEGSHLDLCVGSHARRQQFTVYCGNVYNEENWSVNGSLEEGLPMTPGQGRAEQMFYSNTEGVTSEGGQES